MMREIIDKAAMNFQRQVDKKLKEIYDSLIEKGYKKEDFSLGVYMQRPNYYEFRFKDEVVDMIEFTHQFMVDGMPLKKYLERY